MKGFKDGKEKTVFLYNVADHKEAFNEVGSQGISYTAGVPRSQPRCWSRQANGT